MTPPKKTQTARITEPAAETATAERPTGSAPSTLEAVHSLLKSLGHEPEDVAGVEITGRYVRVLGKDRSMRSHRLEGLA